jgi:hypothetical protein
VTHYRAAIQARRRECRSALYDTGHFVLETHVHEIGAVILKFLERNLSQQAAR